MRSAGTSPAGRAGGGQQRPREPGPEHRRELLLVHPGAQVGDAVVGEGDLQALQGPGDVDAAGGDAVQQRGRRVGGQRRQLPGEIAVGPGAGRAAGGIGAGHRMPPFCGGSLWCPAAGPDVGGSDAGGPDAGGWAVRSGGGGPGRGRCGT
ncbi:hypothetical protein [Actinomadura madurae]|uniref:hypothetical protein n=1 Tax=Actinomadura madurae TaxID=1993 RepID=UPI0020D1F97D|nr:hypothetical protein [Actinomadura madurae]MCQ0013137.1 hypothetical protein [Actinomadura madurae]